MNDAIALVLVWIVLAFCIVIARGGDVVAWLREEIARARARTWAPGTPGTLQDPRVARVFAKQRELAEQMREQGRTLLSGKEYVPELTKPAEPPAPRADKVVTLRRRAA
jgi:hypothetical protein